MHTIPEFAFKAITIQEREKELEIDVFPIVGRGGKQQEVSGVFA
jgi:hypothetical protein